MPTIIKAGDSGPILQSLCTVDLADHLAEADSIVQSARRRGEQIVKDAREQANGIREEAKRSGYEDGLESGYAKGEQEGKDTAFESSVLGFAEEHAHLVSDMKRVIAEFDGMKRDLMVAAERDLLSFAIRLAEKMTFSIGDLHRESAIANVRRALQQVASNTDLTVRLHPKDVESMKIFAESLGEQLEASRCMAVVGDEVVSPGGCIVKSNHSTVDATLETQIDEIVTLLVGRNRHDD